MGKEKRAKSKKNGPLVIALETATVPQIVPQVIGDDTGDSVPRRRPAVQRVPAQPQEIEDSDSDSDSDDSSSSSSSSLPNFQQLCQTAPVGPLERAAEPPQFIQASPPASPEAQPKPSEGIDVPVPMPVTIKGLSNELQAEATPSPPEGEAEQLSFPRKPRAAKPGSITFNMQGAQKAMAAARTRVQVQTAVEAAKAKRLNVKDAATQTVRDPERQDGDIVTIWRLRPRGMESFPHFAKQPKVGKRSNTKDLEAEVNVDPRDPSERKRARTIAAEVKEVSIDVGGDDTGELSGGEAMFDPYQTTFDEVAPDAAD